MKSEIILLGLDFVATTWQEEARAVWYGTTTGVTPDTGPKWFISFPYHGIFTMTKSVIKQYFFYQSSCRQGQQLCAIQQLCMFCPEKNSSELAALAQGLSSSVGAVPCVPGPWTCWDVKWVNCEGLQRSGVVGFGNSGHISKLNYPEENSWVTKFSQNYSLFWNQNAQITEFSSLWCSPRQQNAKRWYPETMRGDGQGHAVGDVIKENQIWVWGKSNSLSPLLKTK